MKVVTSANYPMPSFFSFHVVAESPVSETLRFYVLISSETGDCAMNMYITLIVLGRLDEPAYQGQAHNKKGRDEVNTRSLLVDR